MAVRAIDAVQVLHDINLHHRPTPASEFESGFNDGLNQAMWEITHAPTLTQPNEPLTLDELREMDGEPVWVENKNNPALSGWGIMLENICSAYHDIFSIEQYNKTWIAYRRPKEEQ